MYNEDIKRLFINQLDSSHATKIYIEKFFNMTEQIESKYCLDICALDSNIISNEMSEGRNIKASSAELRKHILLKYVSWCIDNNISGANSDIKNVKLKTTQAIKRSLVSSPLHLEVVLNKAFSSTDKNTVDNVYRSFLWMAFSGIEMDDAMVIKTSEVDMQKMIITHNEISYPIYRESIPAISSCVNQTHFTHYHPKTGVHDRYRFSSDILLRGIKSDPKRTTIVAVINKKIKACQELVDIPSISYERLSLSGFFYRLYDLERAGCDISGSVSKMAMSRIESTYNKFDKTHTKSSLSKKIEKEIIKDYNSWKDAFK